MPARGGALLRDLLLRHVMFRIDGPHHQIAQQSEQQHAGEHIHRDVVRLMRGHSACELELADVVDDDWTENAGDGPCSQQTPVDRADMLRTEEIGKVGGYRSRSHRRTW